VTATEFRDALSGLGLSQVRAAMLFGVSDRVVRMWIAGDRAVPELVARVVRLAVSGRFDLDLLQP
jgi:predicted transcriptional regulator